ncbi:PTS sugar transporter subunit IIA [Listeria welshimeri]|uniref:PTS system, fructose family, IIA component n=1 Tax=Listeria welshimeri serovar 6b (strain ATCC 35897 / DSM 20650 / CCUG 15529 / CIP 8149 / NCTC 11857 / SLCC 5334 / V8) TaxID=386043 RepID=A0AEL0_LISW6|nr:PTS sugar transporter subunit IIA [Listeria welshimeri]MBC1252713.1 PTS sugar transporter subunit IIA [Listeria welshimeri]MBC1340879.1 PTS sugar transporter subunit IIA [Listeria welshimeri]MBC1346925.1 PTS sugar transporter subunit IIA [Listeria welshimeri]MBC1360759.1 PTS sugar transporter subunit IIA [Listeria welshimeri]MBC1370224.1 PTS sugar transporter subunit IIA [Listeria welshimeri]
MNYIIAAHGRYAQEVKNSCQMITGQTTNIAAVTFTEDMGVTDVLESYNAVYSPENETVIIVDIVGGTPCNAAQMFRAKYPEIKIVSGLSLGLIIPLSLGESLEGAIIGAQENIQFVELKANNSTVSDDGEEED